MLSSTNARDPKEQAKRPKALLKLRNNEVSKTNLDGN